MAVKLHGWVMVTDDFELMMISALRYAIERGSYLPGTAIEYIRYLIPQLSAKTLCVMKRDIEEEVSRHERLHKKRPQIYSELYMAKEWQKLAEDMGVESEKKKAVQE